MLSALAEGVKLLILSTHISKKEEKNSPADKPERNYASLAKALAEALNFNHRIILSHWVPPAAS